MKKTKSVPFAILAICLSMIFHHINAQKMIPTVGNLSNKEKSIVTIAAFSATGDLPNLKISLNTGLEAGLTVNEIREELVHLYAYCGFPRSLNAINTLMEVLKERKAKGISDVEGREASPIAGNADKYEQGRLTLEELTKTPQSKPAKGFGEFAPRIDAFLKEHLFANIFENDILSYRQRELVTISVLSSMPGVESQLKSHIQVGKNTGITENELMELAELIETHINRTQANVLRKLLSQPFLPVINPDMMVRIAEIEIFPEFLENYKAILKEEAAASVKNESGVVVIFPMFQKENPTQIRLLEIYESVAAYNGHIKSPHFLHYKTSTSKMVKSLKLIDMDALDSETMTLLFKKLNP